MDESIYNFARKLMQIAPPLQNVVEEECYEWEPSKPPETVLLGALGRTLAEHYLNIEVAQRQAILELVEQGIQSEDLNLSTALSTGFLEALSNRAIRGGMELWQTVQSELGEKSKAYLSAWLGHDLTGSS